MSKITKIPSEIRSFFSEKRRSFTMDAFTRLVENINLDSRNLGGIKLENCQLIDLQVFQILLLLPFFAVKGFSHYGSLVLHSMFEGKKDVFYLFISQDTINWRKLIYRINSWLITKVVVRNDYKKNHLPTVLIADDADLPKTGLYMEAIGKIFSHVHQRCNLDYKALMLCWSDGRTQFMLDFSLHGEKGKIVGKKQGLTSDQRQKRYKREREKGTAMAKRKGEFFKSKGEKLVELVKEAISNKVPFEYLLVDSWFTCTELVDFVCRRHKKFHLLGMAKMSNTKYATAHCDDLSAKAIIAKLKAAKEIKYSRLYRCHYT